MCNSRQRAPFGLWSPVFAAPDAFRQDRRQSIPEGCSGASVEVSEENRRASQIHVAELGGMSTSVVRAGTCPIDRGADLLRDLLAACKPRTSVSCYRFQFWPMCRQ